MDRVHDSVAWYQKKIGSYDKHIWELSAEQKVLRSIQQAPRRSVRQKTELIDVDLVRGSTFSRAKPQVSWTYITHKAITRVIFFPVFYKWWLQQMPIKTFVFLMVLYTMQVISLIVFFRNVGGSIMKDEQTLSEVVIPALLMLILGQIHSQTVLSHFSHRSQHRDGKHIRKSSSALNRDSKGRPSRLHCNNIKRSYSVPNQTVGTIYENASPQVDNSNLKQQDGKATAGEHPASTKVKIKPAGKQNGSMTKVFDVSKVHKDSVSDKGPIIKNGHNTTEQKSVSWSDAYCVASPHTSGHESPDSDARTDEEEYQMEDKEISEKDLGSEEELENDKLFHDKLRCKDNTKDIQSPEKSSDTMISNGKVNGPNSFTDVIIPHNGEMCCKGEKTDVSNNGTNVETVGVSEENLKVENVSGDILSTDLKSVTSNRASSNDQRQKNSSQFHLSETADSAIILPKKQTVLMNGEMSASPKSADTISGINSLPERLVSSLPSDDVFVDEVARNSDKLLDDNASDYSPQDTESVYNSSLGSIDSAKCMMSSVMKGQGHCESGSDSDDTHNKKLSYKGLRRRKNNLPEDGIESNSGIFRSRRPPSSLSMKGRNSKGSTGISSSEGEASYTPDGSKAGASSEAEWEDRVQSDITTSTYSSSSGSDAEMSENDPQDLTEDFHTDLNTSPNAGQSAVSGERTGSLHVINLLQPGLNSTTVRTRSRSYSYGSSVSNRGMTGLPEHPTSTTSVSPPPDKVSCVIWEDKECKKVELTALDIGWTIIEKVDNIPESSDYLWIGFGFSIFLGFVPLIFRVYHAKEYPDLLTTDGLYRLCLLWVANSWRLNLIMVNGLIQRLCLGGIFFFLLSVADRTFKQRLLYAKHFCYLTSSRRARKFDMPHFRLNKVRNIKIWLSLRSYLKKRGPQRSVDIIVSVTFLLTIVILTLMCLQLLKDTDTYLDFLCNWELLVWCMAMGVYLLRFMTLGLKINKKYRNLSVLITEQINLYLQMEQKPHKKEELMVANNVLKLAEDLLKELESPFKISGVSANPVIYNVTKVVVLSAFSAVLTELLGFKMKLYKIKLRA